MLVFHLLFSFARNIIRAGVKQFGSRSGSMILRPDMGQNYLQMLSAEDNNRQRVHFLS